MRPLLPFPSCLGIPAQSRRIAELEVAFKKECRFGEKVEVATELNGAETRHRISAVSDGRELSRVRIVWK